MRDDLLRESLFCIRCGACMNHCPVYVNVTGHAYQSEIPGPIGKIMMPQLMGLKQKSQLPGMSSLCGACQEVCPVQIPIPKILLKLRSQSVGAFVDEEKSHILEYGQGRKFLENALWNVWSFVYTSSRRLGILKKIIVMMGRGLPTFSRFFPLLRVWTQGRSVPNFSNTSLKELMKKNGNIDQ